MQYRCIFKTIPAGNGEFHEVCFVDPRQRRFLEWTNTGAWFFPGLLHKQETFYSLIYQGRLENVVHGNRMHRDRFTCAALHRGFRWTVTMTLSRYYDSVTPERTLPLVCCSSGSTIRNFLDWVGEEVYWMSRRYPPEARLSSRLTERDFFPRGRAMRGLPTSPTLANMAAAAMDEEILRTVRTSPGSRLLPPGHVVYTRYAEELAFSGNLEIFVPFILEKVPGITERHGFHVAPHQNVVMHESGTGGCRVICGVALRGHQLLTPHPRKRRGLSPALPHGPVTPLAPDRNGASSIPVTPTRRRSAVTPFQRRIVLEEK